MNKNHVVKSNQVIEASYQLSAVEQRIVLAAISRIPKNQPITDDELYPVSVDELKQLGVHEKTAYRDLKEGINRLYERSINLSIDDKSIKMRWVQEIQFLDSQSVIGIRFSKPILPFISNLSREFTKYALSDIAGINSGYGIRIYELLVQYRQIGKREISVESLRTMLELGKKYPLFADFKKRVIDTAIDQINEYSPLKVTYEQKKTGRKVTHIIFSFKEKSKSITHTSKDFYQLSDAQINLFGNQLSRLHELSHLASEGESYEILAAKIKDMLRNPHQQQQFLPHLKNLGFKA
ncbi:replication protein [Acinetobacter baumannii]|uniref:RepB family plasmid replication initiator protein n=12 Tax=Gammaproteobacteria TaxID=1236 RepID=A0A0J8UW68_ACIBA|nr:MULTISPECIES: replication initiation protein RepM [Acinetobacter]KCX86572.1 initiator Replication family protein [Acinetobacter baumannii 6112]KCZ28808.1 initiator Replication family protein [Acinetobacter baumannii 25977_9]MDR0069376.1 replication initiation protein RepM [Acinetobacter sp. 11520]HIQ15436.1 RepB family plasmid replication initiator protein [Leucothrix sp.]HIQ27758.1 RepB family plasmid replication initiator protein [Sulfurovum sp.]